MTRTTYKFVEGDLVDRDGFPLLNQYERAAEPCMPYVMSDIPEYKNMVDGGIIGSRSEHREFLRKNGLVEIGNEGLEVKARKTHAKHEVAKDIKETIDQLSSGYVNPDEGVLTPEMEADFEREAAADLDGIKVDDNIAEGDFVRSEIEAKK